MCKDEQPLLVQLLIEPEPRRRARDHVREHRLAHGERHIVGVKIDQVERAHMKTSVS